MATIINPHTGQPVEFDAIAQTFNPFSLQELLQQAGLWDGFTDQDPGTVQEAYRGQDNRREANTDWARLNGYTTGRGRDGYQVTDYLADPTGNIVGQQTGYDRQSLNGGDYAKMAAVIAAGYGMGQGFESMGLGGFQPVDPFTMSNGLQPLSTAGVDQALGQSLTQLGGGVSPSIGVGGASQGLGAITDLAGNAVEQFVTTGARGGLGQLGGIPAGSLPVEALGFTALPELAPMLDMPPVSPMPSLPGASEAIRQLGAIPPGSPPVPNLESTPQFQMPQTPAIPELGKAIGNGLLDNLPVKQLVGAALGAAASKDTTQESTRDPWAPAQDFIKQGIAQGQQLQQQYAQQPFSPTQQAAYNNFGGLLNSLNSGVGGLLGGMGANASGQNQFSRNNPRAGLMGGSLNLSGFNPQTLPLFPRG